MTNSRRSVLFGMLGVLAMLGFNLLGYHTFLNRMKQSVLIILLDVNSPWSLITIIFVIAAVYYGIKARRQKEKHAYLGIALAICTLILIIFPLWPAFVSLDT